MMGRLSLALLGGMEIKLDGEPVTGLKTDKVRALLVYLAVERNRPHRRQSLAGLLWPDFPETKARTNLRHALANLRKSLGEDHNHPPYILVDSETIQFNPENNFWLDAGEFEALFNASRAITSDADHTLNKLQDAIDLYRGPFLEGFSLRDTPEYDSWAMITRERYQVMVSDTLSILVGDFESRNELENAILYARRRLELEPWEEDGHRQLMRLLVMDGQRAAALAQYETCKKNLESELGVKPSAESVSLYEQIRDGEITKKEPVGRRGNLPAQLTSFIGRSEQIEQVEGLMDSHRLVTITGPGGIGKTRLGLQVAMQLEGHFKDGVWWVELAPISDPDLVPETVVRSLGIHLESREKALSSLKFFLEEKHLLLVLDNCEHLVEACANLADTLLRSCPELSILATSREAHGIKGESIYSLPPMELPDEAEARDVDCLVEIEAFRLFTDRAKVVSPNFEVKQENAQTIARICCQVDGIPLAIELAAARVRMMGVDEIFQRLEDRFQLLTGGGRATLPRYQTLRASIDWSYELLTSEEQTLLQRLSVFAGRWTLDGAEYVGGGDGIETYQVLDLLGELVDKSLVTTYDDPDVGTHYRMLETIRQYIYEKLVEAGGLPTAHDYHLRYYVELAERLEKVIRGPSQGAILRRLETEMENIRLAFTWSLKDEGDVGWKTEKGMRLGSALMWFWHSRHRVEESFQWLTTLLAREQEISVKPKIITDMIRAKTLLVTGFLAMRNLKHIQAIDFCSESRDTYLQLGSQGRLGYARSLLYLGYVSSFELNEHVAEKYGKESLNIFEELGDQFWKIQSLCLLGDLASARGSIDVAKRYYESALTLSREIGDLDGIAYHLWKLADIMVGQIKSFDKSLAKQTQDMLIESLGIFKEIESIHGEILIINSLADLNWKLGNYHRSEEYFFKVASYNKKFLGRKHVEGLRNLGRLMLSHGEYHRANEFYKQSLNISKKGDWKYSYVGSLLDLGLLAWELGSYDQAVEYYETSLIIVKNHEPKFFEYRSLYGLGKVMIAKGLYYQGRAYLEEALSIANYSECVEAFAFLAMYANAQKRAIRMLGATEKWHVDRYYMRTPKERQERKQAITTARQTLGEETFNAAWEEGVAMTLDEAIEYALEGDGPS